METLIPIAYLFWRPQKTASPSYPSKLSGREEHIYLTSKVSF